MKCELCGKDNLIKKFIVSGPLKYSKCKTCGLIFQNPMPTFEELEKIYNNYYTKTTKIEGSECGYTNYEEERSEKVFEKDYWETIEKYHKSGNFLDFGCGTGNLIMLLKRKGLEAEGLEFSDDALMKLKQRGISYYKYSDLGKINKTFDNIMLIHTIEHLRTPMSDLKNINRLLNKDGILILETINSDDWFANNIYKGKWGISQTHLYLWGKRTLIDALKRSGFEPVEITTRKSCGPWLLAIGKRILCKTKLVFTFGDVIRIVAKKVNNV